MKEWGKNMRISWTDIVSWTNCMKFYAHIHTNKVYTIPTIQSKKNLISTHTHTYPQAETNRMRMMECMTRDVDGSVEAANQ